LRWFHRSGPDGLRFSPDDLVAVVRSHRHTVLNDLQVLAGWLQLGRIDTALEYLEKVKSRLELDSGLGRLGCPELEAALHLVKSRAEGVGLTFTALVTAPSEPAYLAAAAATREEDVGAGWRLAVRQLAPAVRALLEHIVARVSGEGLDRLEVHVGLSGDAPEGRPEVRVCLPSGAGDWVGSRFEDEVLVKLGFDECPRGEERGIGVERRPRPDGGFDIVLAARF